jgi:glycosyltransferase involved in cell wall biosynthesis
MRRIADLLYRRSNAVVVLAPASRDNVIAHGAQPSRVHLLPNGVDLEAFDGATSSDLDLARPERFTFVYAGAHGPANGLDVVVDACELLQRRGDRRVRVVLIGDGPVKPDITQAAADASQTNLELLDPVPKSEIAAVLRSADAGLMVLAAADLFTYGVSPNKLFDYLAADLPVVTNVPGLVSEIVEATGAGIVAPAGDAAALADAMTSMASWPPARLLSSGGRAYIAKHHDRRRLALALDALLRSVASDAENRQQREV